jgi:hypothetical protein
VAADTRTVYLTCDQEALVEAVGEGLELPETIARILVIGAALLKAPTPEPPPKVPFTPLEEVGRAIRRRVHSLDLPAIVRANIDRLWREC